MKIVYLAEWYPYMSAKVTQSIAQRLAKMGCEVVVLTSDIDLNGRRGHLPHEQTIDGVAIKRMNATRVTTSSIPYVFYNPISVVRRRRAIAREIDDADIIHSQTIHGLLNIGIDSLLILQRHASKLVVGSHGIPSYNSIGSWIGFGLWNVLMRQIATKSRLVFTVSKSSVPTLVKLGIAPDRIRHIPNGVDCSTFVPSIDNRQGFRRSLGLNDDDVLVMSLGQIRAAKGIAVLLESIPEILTSNRHVKVLIAGSGPMAPLVLRWTNQQPKLIKDKIILVPRNITEPELPRFFAACDIFVLPSYWEGSPLSLLEAMACGTCPVASRVGDIPHTIENGVNGCLVEPGNSKELARIISHLSLNSELRQSLGKASAQTAMSYSWDTIAKQYYDSYASIVC